MSEKIYNWKRYWHPSHLQPPLLDNGFLHIARGSHYPFSQENTDFVTFDEIGDHQCLVLLGEPGMGKSYALKDALNSLNGSTLSDREILLFKLADYSDENRIVRKLFQSDIFQRWLSGSHSLHLFIDDLDEARLKIDTITHTLFDELSEIKNSLPRLFLRITCRTSDWPQGFEQQLRDLYGKQQVSVYNLAPLQIEDAKEAAEAHNINWEVFRKEIFEKEIGPLAANPITLKLLLAQYNHDHGLPSTRREIYEKGCLALCKEIKPRHQERDRLQEEEKRFEIAARIAACMVFANYQSISVIESISDGIDGSLLLTDITDPPGTDSAESFSVYRGLIEETLETALFQGSTSKTWAHRTFAEFLAAWYAFHRLSEQQIKDLLFLNGNVVPQLREVGAWLASFNDGIWSAIMENDPDLLLRSDVSIADERLKARWVESLLHKHNISVVLDYRTRWRYHKLKHSDLTAQLRPLLEDKSLPLNVRIAAVEIAAACNEQSLQNSLVAVALDPNETIKLREDAANALIEIADSTTKAQLKPLALLPILDSETRKLKEYALKCVWPDHITTAELFDSIDLHDKSNHDELSSKGQERDLWFIGDYLPRLLESNLDKVDLITCLQWVQNQRKSQELPPAYQEVIALVMLYAWDYIDREEVANAFTGAVLARLYLHDSIIPHGSANEADFETKVVRDDLRRQRILRQMLLHLSAWNHTPERLIYSNTPFLLAQDVPYFIKEFSMSDSAHIRANWARILYSFLPSKLNHEQIAYLYNACQTNADLNQALYEPFDAKSLESEIAKIWRQHRAEREEHEAEMIAWRVNKPFLDPLPQARIAEFLAECESGNHESWCLISCWMMVQADGSREQYHVEETQIENLPVWQELADEQQGKVVQTAKDYILNFAPGNDEWLKEGKYVQNNSYYRVVAGYRAFCLLLVREREFILGLPSIIWQNWAATVLYYSWSSYQRAQANWSDPKPHEELLRCAYQHVPEQIVVALLLIIEHEDEYRIESLLEWIAPLWDNRLATALIEKLQDESLKPNTMYELLLQTMQQGDGQAKQYAESLVQQLLPNPEGQFAERAVLAARALLKGTKDAGWYAVWPTFQAYPEFGKQVLGWIVLEHDHRFSRRSYLLHKLTERQLVDFYLWLCQQFPPSADRRGGGPVTQREEFANLRNTVLFELQDHDPRQAIQSLQAIDRLLPQNELVRWRLAQVQDRLQRETWQPLSPRQILDLARKHKASLSQSEKIINTGGGTYITGDVNTGGGDFIGRDKNSM